MTGYLNLNSYRNYPFAENATLVDTTGSFDLFPGVIADFVAYGVDADRTYYLAYLDWVGRVQLTLHFQDDLGNASTSVVFGIPSYSADPNTAYSVRNFLADGTTVSGRVVVNLGKARECLGRVTSDSARFYFTPVTARIEPALIVPPEIAVTSLQAYGAENILRGNVKLKPGMNFSLTKDEVDGSLRFEAIEGAGEWDPVALCADTTFCNRFFTKTENLDVTCKSDKTIAKINNVEIADGGCNVRVVPGNCMKVQTHPEQHMLIIGKSCPTYNICDYLKPLWDRLCSIESDLGISHESGVGITDPNALYSVCPRDVGLGITFPAIPTSAERIQQMVYMNAGGGCGPIDPQTGIQICWGKSQGPIKWVWPDDTEVFYPPPEKWRIGASSDVPTPTKPAIGPDGCPVFPEVPRPDSTDVLPGEVEAL